MFFLFSSLTTDKPSCQYIGSRIYYFKPPGKGGMMEYPQTPPPFKKVVKNQKAKQPDVNQWVCILFLILNIGVMAATSEWVCVVK